ncbi:MAG: HAMP domain-containing sensor histidine kinase [Longimicrobiales bacterium]
MTPSFSMYRAMCRIPGPRSYVGKFLLTAFLGVHVPLLALLGYVAVGTGDWEVALPILVVALVATLGGTAATLWVQWSLLAPVVRTSAALLEYRADGTLPDLPTEFHDEAGLLMAHARSCVEHLDELVALRLRLLGMVSHDLKGLVGTVALANQIAADELTGPDPDLAELRAMSEMVDEAVGRQDALIRNVMSLARAESGALPVRRSAVSLAELADRALMPVRFAARSKGIALHARGANVVVHIDGEKIDQVLQNLVHNAVKFTPSGGHVGIDIDWRDDRVAIEVRDTGTGMTEEVQAGLFAPFTSAQRAGTASEAGTGLGMWICRTLVELQDGTIAVRSAPGEGTVFRVDLPASKATPSMVAQAAGELVGANV